VGGRLLAHAEMVRGHGVILVGNALRVRWRTPCRLNVATAGGEKNGVVPAVRRAPVEPPEGDPDPASRHEKGGGEGICPLLDHVGRIVGTGIVTLLFRSSGACAYSCA